MVMLFGLTRRTARQNEKSITILLSRVVATEALNLDRLPRTVWQQRAVRETQRWQTKTTLLTEAWCGVAGSSARAQLVLHPAAHTDRQSQTKAAVLLGRKRTSRRPPAVIG